MFNRHSTLFVYVLCFLLVGAPHHVESFAATKPYNLRSAAVRHATIPRGAKSSHQGGALQATRVTEFSVGNFRETPQRSLVKAVLWRVFSGTVSFCTSYCFSQSSTVAVQFVSVSFLPKALLLFLGDQAVAASPVGRARGADTISRSLVKAVVLRTVSILINVSIATLALRQSLAVAAHIVSSDTVVKTCSLFVYERLWAHASWGKVPI